MHQSPRAEGVEEIFVPGEIEARKARTQLQEGIAYPLTVIEELTALSKELGVPPLNL
ncbi:Ldh family oxidoreductase [Alkalihalobacillus oceani]|nr:Ldh family oxidoreductase [Halalkalibacter oceani]MCM3762101.1 Ldh family oxidoreductase [Halalkalibacter oceani]